MCKKIEEIVVGVGYALAVGFIMVSCSRLGSNPTIATIIATPILLIGMFGAIKLGEHYNPPTK